MENTDNILLSVDEIADSEAIFMKWRYLNGFTLFVMLDQRRKVEPLGDLSPKGIKKYQELWLGLHQNVINDYCNRAKLLRSEMDTSKIKQAVYPRAIVNQQPNNDVITILGPQLLRRDVSTSNLRE